MSGKIVVVTGGDKGIGYEIVRNLARSLRGNVCFVIACRNNENGEEAVKQLSDEFPEKNFELGIVNLAKTETIKDFANKIKEQFNQVDILVHNAAIAFKKNDETPQEEQARKTLKIDYFGTLELNKELLPLVERSKNGNIVFMGSHSAKRAFDECSEDLKEKWQSAASVDQVSKLIEEYLFEVQKGSQAQTGWPGSSYGVAKLAVVALSKVLAKEHPNLIVNAADPGYVSTDMTNHKGTRSPAEGAQTPAFLATCDDKSKSGHFWRDKEVVSFI